MKRATIYRRKTQFFVHASSRTTEGVWILTEPCLGLEQVCSDRELGEAVRKALDGSRSDIPHPRSWAGLLDPLLKQAGVKSWNTFSKTASCAEIEEDEGEVALMPTKKLGVEEGFQADHSKAATVATGAVEDLGSQARRLLQ